MKNFELRAMADGAVRISKVYGTLDDYDAIQDAWDLAYFDERVDFWFEKVDEDTDECYLCWAVWAAHDDVAMWELYYDL